MNKKGMSGLLIFIIAVAFIAFLVMKTDVAESFNVKPTCDYFHKTESCKCYFGVKTNFTNPQSNQTMFDCTKNITTGGK